MTSTLPGPFLLLNSDGTIRVRVRRRIFGDVVTGATVTASMYRGTSPVFASSYYSNDTTNYVRNMTQVTEPLYAGDTQTDPIYTCGIKPSEINIEGIYSVVVTVTVAGSPPTQSQHVMYVRVASHE